MRCVATRCLYGCDVSSQCSHLVDLCHSFSGMTGQLSCSQALTCAHQCYSQLDSMGCAQSCWGNNTSQFARNVFNAVLDCSQYACTISSGSCASWNATDMSTFANATYQATFTPGFVDVVDINDWAYGQGFTRTQSVTASISISTVTGIALATPFTPIPPGFGPILFQSQLTSGEQGTPQLFAPNNDT